MNHKIFKNASWIIATRIVQSVFNLIITMMTARYLGPSNFGSINYAASVVAFVTPLVHLGLTSIAVQELVNKPEEEGVILGTSLFYSFISSILAFIGVISFVLIANSGETETIIVCILYSLVLFVTSFDVLRYWFQSKLLSKYISLVSLFAFIITSIYKAFLLITGKSIYWFALSNLIDYLLIAILSVVLYKKLGGNSFKISFNKFKLMLNKSKYYIISELMVVIFAQTDKIMLKLMIDESATGFYSAAVTCSGITAFVFAALIDSFRPVIFESKKSSPQSFYNKMCRLYSIIIYFSLIQCILITIFSKYIVLILYGAEFLPTVNALRIVAWYTTFSYLGSVRNIWILAENKQHNIWKIDLSGAIANVILNFLLIPRFGIYGAAMASLITQIFTNVIVVAMIKEVRFNIKLMYHSLSPKWIFGLIQGFVLKK